MLTLRGVELFELTRKIRISLAKRIFHQKYFILIIRGPGGFDSWRKKIDKKSGDTATLTFKIQEHEFLSTCNYRKLKNVTESEVCMWKLNHPFVLFYLPNSGPNKYKKTFTLELFFEKVYKDLFETLGSGEILMWWKYGNLRGIKDTSQKVFSKPSTNMNMSS